ncbi:chaperone modulator CbpM [Cryptosporangium sp. NPDC048952]|uniref:chaperone modulator CbpM n=1 Tax=Cryptosporangium sp. NPDC048952 TaxID=3363961 RepID=UPI003716521C
MTYPLTRTPGHAIGWLSLTSFSSTGSVHPEMVQRLVTLGLLAPERDAAGNLWFERDQLLALARIRRLRTGLGVNYAAIGLVIDLLDRITALERELRVPTSRRTGGSSWT